MRRNIQDRREHTTVEPRGCSPFLHSLNREHVLKKYFLPGFQHRFTHFPVLVANGFFSNVANLEFFQRAIGALRRQDKGVDMIGLQTVPMPGSRSVMSIAKGIWPFRNTVVLNNDAPAS